MAEQVAPNLRSTEAPSIKQELASQLVQEIASNNAEVPERYHHRDGFPDAIDDTHVWRNDLLIDYSLLSSALPSELAKLRFALSQWGCFQVINHGIQSSFLEELIEVSRQFFALPLDEKLKCSSEDDLLQGYGSDSLYSGTQTLHWNDRIVLTLNPKENCKFECWPQKPKKFRELIEDYSKKLTTVNKGIFKALARSLDLQEDSFVSQRKYLGPKIAKFNFYPRCSSPASVLGANPHTDASILTYLFPEKEVEGLQILKDDQWYKVPAVPDALFINFGDLGEILTNGLFKSAMHRVATNSEKDRISVAMFFIPNPDEEVEPLCELVSAHQRQVYKKLNMSEFPRLLRESFVIGRSQILDASRV